MEEERLRAGGELVPISIRNLVQSGQIDASGLTARLTQAYLRHGCDGLFAAAVSHDGVRIPMAPLLAALRREAHLEFAVIDGAQELAHVPIDLATTACDIWLAGAHKWLGGHQPLGVAALANPHSAVDLQESLVADVQAMQDDDPLLRFLLHLEGREVSDARETVNLAPLFSTWGALRDILTDASGQARRFRQRQENTALFGQLVEQHGWKPRAVDPTLATGIAIIQSHAPEICRLPAQVLEATIENAGVTTTALDRGRLRLSFPAHPLDDGQLAHLMQTLNIGRRGHFPSVATSATQQA
jgi:hypothetical protein